MRTTFALFAAVAIVGAAPSDAGQSHGDLSAAQMTAIDRIGMKSIAEHYAPSVVIGVERNGKTVYLRAFGDRIVESRTPSQGSTPYQIGSNTKQFAAAAILLLQDQGKLDVDDRLSKY